ncbi:protein cab-1 [Malaya genurostris]|uniref:protein cab-1 n=1 Tax=Malaya genurostris TaxID=325434 RepID=UPI0026F3A50B|nr:protein cab-1 [Malaya genurostris]XP_058455445.1 protein cab-1 [Malaya genurostris]XP_058455446.1 protein cab-1 [Malaya genurostris]
MHILIFAAYSCFIVLSTVRAEHDYFPGLRRTKPSQMGHTSWASNDGREAPEFLKTINELIEEQARRRFLEHLQRFQLNRNILQRAELEENARPAFSYQLPLKDDIDLNKPVEFAVDPSDPRFYDRMLNVVSENHDGTNLQIEKITDKETISESQANLPPSPQVIKPKHPIYSVNKYQNVENKLRQTEQRVDENLLPQRVNGVIQRPVEMDGAVAMYIVALIGGISAAVTVGLISVGIGWYTLHKKAKAAADVDYPAYGVTGPNKDSSPTGDRKLAQSAQMYHYQHQKQQIIAMENHNNLDKNGSHSDPESEDDNEEGDYTVYECPGLAPTAEMEVKNPMFLDDTTLTPRSSHTPDSKVLPKASAGTEKSLPGGKHTIQ